MDLTGISHGSELPEVVQRDLDRLKEATGQVIGSVFFGTLLRTMRESPFKGPYGHGGRGEEVFSAQLHGIYAEQAGGTLTGQVQDALYRHLERQQRLISQQRLVAPDVPRSIHRSHVSYVKRSG